jgi:hypothetical protein
MKKRIELNLPEWAFLDCNTHLGNELGNRTVILHVRSASVIEIFDIDREVLYLDKGAVSFAFKNYAGESLIAVLHYCTTLDKDTDRGMIVEQVLIPCAEFYADYTEWEDRNMIESEVSGLN